MKLLFTQDALVNAGAERSHLEILSRFSAETEVCFAYFYPKHDLKGDYELVGIRLFFLDIPESYHFHLAIYRLVNLIRTEKPDLLVSCLWRADIITRIASLLTGVPLVGTLVNDSYSPIAWTDKKGLKYKLVYWLDRLTSGIPVHWIANAQALAYSHVKTLGLDSNKISVVYRGREVTNRVWGSGRLESERTEIERLENERVENRRLENSSPHSYWDEREVFKFLSFGRLLERKGFQDAIQAFSLVLQKYPDCTLTVYGEGPYRSQLEGLIARLGLTTQVKLPGKFYGPTNPLSPNPLFSNLSSLNLLSPKLSSPNLYSLNPLNLLLSSDCFLFPSWYEGFSGSLIEAMMVGIPIIASDIPMNLEAVTPDQNGLTFPVKDVKALTDQMIFAIENPARMADLGKRAMAEAVARFDIEKIAKEYERVLYLTPALFPIRFSSRDRL